MVASVVQKLKEKILCAIRTTREMLIIISFREEDSRQVKRVEEVLRMQHIMIHDSKYAKHASGK